MCIRDRNDTDYLSSRNIRIINGWLTSPQTPKLFKIIGGDYFYEDIEFFATFTEITTDHVVFPYEMNFTVTCDSPYGYTPEITHNKMCIRDRYQAEATDGDFEKGIKSQTKAIAEQAEETDKAWKAIAKADDKEAARATYDAEKDKLKDARDEYLSYMQSQSEWQATKKQQQELLSYYSQWQRAQSTELSLIHI